MTDDDSWQQATHDTAGGGATFDGGREAAPEPARPSARFTWSWRGLLLAYVAGYGTLGMLQTMPPDRFLRWRVALALAYTAIGAVSSSVPARLVAAGSGCCWARRNWWCSVGAARSPAMSAPRSGDRPRCAWTTTSRSSRASPARYPVPRR